MKFRIWDKKYEKMYYEDDNVIYFEIGLDGVVSAIHNHLCREPEDFILMQYTGLRDKNGREIYEGDILKIYREDIYDNSTEIEKIGKVVFRDGAFFLEPALEEGWFYILSSELEYWDNEGYEYEVVGNVFEKPELLKNKNKIF